MINSAPGWTDKNFPSPTGVSSKPSGPESCDPGSTLLFLDNDILVTLAAADLLAEAVNALGFSFPTCRRLDTVEHMLRRGAFDIASDEARQRALETCRMIPAIKDRLPDDILLDRLAVCADPGEAGLIARTIQGPHLMASGDKRWMKVLCKDPALSDVRAALCGKVVCLETMIALVVARLGHLRVTRSFSFVTEHTVLRIIRATADGENLRATLTSYVVELEGYVGSGFLRHA